jgi:hypothetical protein
MASVFTTILSQVIKRKSHLEGISTRKLTTAWKKEVRAYLMQ